MLEVYDADNRAADIIDIDAAFSKLMISDEQSIAQMVSAVDEGTLVDANTFRDRFGVRLYLSELSTGCKAAICVCCCPDRIVDLQECGLNARDAVFNYCENGKILLHDFGVTIADAHCRATPIFYEGKQYSIESFNEEVL